MKMSELIKQFKETIICLHKFGTIIANRNKDFVAKWIIINYVFNKLKEVLKTKFKYQSLPDQYIQSFIHKCKDIDIPIDHNGYIFVNCTTINIPDWYYICSIKSRRKYKVFAIPADEITENVIYLSETMLFNINQHLGINEQNYLFYFLMPAKEQLQCAKKVSVSLISSTQNYSNNLTRILLENFFACPHFLRTDNIFKINIKDYAPQFFYTNEFPNLQYLYFKVNHIDNEFNYGKYVVKNETELMQEGNVQSFIPKQHFYETMSDKLKCVEWKDLNSLKHLWPPCLERYLEEMETNIAPFLQKDIKIDVHPVFLLRGSQGSGKFFLIQALAKIKGLHFVQLNLSEVQILAAAQKEAKIRIILQNALSCAPCILMLRNIEALSLNTDGKKDERALTALITELKNTFENNLNFPLIIIATSEAKSLPVELEMIFIETVFITYMTKEEKINTLVWLLETKELKYNADLPAIVDKCSDFNFVDLETLVLQATKNCYELLSDKERSQDVVELKLNDNHFNAAYEWMQRIFADEIGVPKIPKVYWEDIGGLVDLKSEIMRRIELPMLMSAEGEKSGLLLYGPPGTGKTLLAKAVATEYKFHFLSVKGPELLNMYVGQSEENIRQIFEKARAAAPCIIFFDELDSLAPNRGHSGDSGGVMDRVVSQLLTELDGVDANGHMVIIGATNRPDLIDPALLRPGRFDKMLYVGMYNDKQSQKSVLEAQTRKFILERNGNELDELVEFLPANLTGADLYAICSDAWMTAARKFIQNNADGLENRDFEKDPVIVTLADFKDALREFKPSVSEDEMRKYIKLKDELS